jgi:cobalt-zinc-cadmium efflux system outer membrane protein
VSVNPFFHLHQVARWTAQADASPGRGWPLPAVLLLVAGAQGQQTLSLHDAVKRALESPRARVAKDQVDLTRAQRTQAALALNPRLYLQSEDLHPWDNNFSFPNGTEDYAYVSQTFEIDGKRAKRIALADADIHTSEAQQSLAVRQIAGSVAAGYWTAVADRQIADRLRQDLAAVDEMVRYHQQRVDAGAMRGVDLIRMEIERDRVSLALQAAERDAELARTELFRQIGSVGGQDVVLTDDIASTEVLPEIDLATAPAQRAEVTVAQDRIAASQADLKLQHAIAIPDPDLFAGYKRNSGIDTAYVALQIPLPFRNRNQGEIARAETQLRIALAGPGADAHPDRGGHLRDAAASAGGVSRPHQQPGGGHGAVSGHVAAGG